MTRNERIAAAVFVLLAYGWATHPVLTVLTVALAVAAAVALWLRRRQLLRAPGQRTWVYRHYDVTGQLLYVGITNNYRLRCEQHADTKHWWWRVDPQRSTTQEFPNRPAALLAEGLAIRAERPLFNVVHNRRLAA